MPVVATHLHRLSVIEQAPIAKSEASVLSQNGLVSSGAWEAKIMINYYCSITGRLQWSLISDGSPMVKMAAFQAVDPGSIPGCRKIFY